MTTSTNSLNYQPTNHGVIVGGANSTIASVAPVAGLHILRTQGSSANPAYSTAAYPSTAGSSGRLVTSNGSDFTSTLPAVINDTTTCITTLTGNPVDGTTYVLAQNTSLTTFTANGAATTRIYAALTGYVIGRIIGAVTVQGTLGSAENCTVAIVVNNSGTNNVVTTLQLTSAVNTFDSGAKSIGVSGTSYYEIKLICPTWVTNPTNVSMSVSVYAT